jgi:hypothetical protein
MLLWLQDDVHIFTIVHVLLKVAAHHLFLYYYSCAYRMAVQKQHYCPEMYNGFKMMLAECVRTMVLYIFLFLLHDLL